ncbi:MAG: TM2 domain-containing protein [Candidatus Aquicultorales bacterium]
MAAQPERKPEREPERKVEEREFVVVEPDLRKSRVAAGVLSILLGWLGVGRFYLGYTGMGILQIIVSLLTGGLGGLIWGVIEGILILTGSFNEDAWGRPLRD